MASAHPELLWIVIASGITCAFLAISIGANDVANAFSTSVGSGTLSLGGAITIAFIFEILGSLFLGGRVSDAIRTRVLNFSAFSDSPYELALGMFCSSVGSTLWLIFATYFGIPVSTTHSIIGALAGFGIASGRLSGVRWIQLLYIILSWFLVPLISIIVTGTFYVIIQELILKKANSFDIMRNYHWVFLIIFTIPLSIFIAFENSFLRATTGELSEAYRKWFNSSAWNKFASVIIVLSVFVLFSCLVTYTICYFRLKSGWSFLESIMNIDNMLAHPQKSETDLNNTDRVNVDNVVENQTIRDLNKKDLEESYYNEDSENFNSDNLSLSGLHDQYGDLSKYTDTSDSQCYITINTESADMSIAGEKIELSEVTKKSFSRSIIDALLGSVGFQMTPRCSRESSRFSSSDLSVRFGESQEIPYNPSMQRQASRFNRFVSNIRNSYSRTLSRSRSSSRYRKYSHHRDSRTTPASRSSTESRSPGKFTRFSGMTAKMRENLNKTQTIFSAMQIVGATISIISHSANDTANAVSPFATVYFLYLDGLGQTTKNTPWFILLCGGLCMSLGLAFFGYKVIKTVGLNITRVTPSRGYTIDSTAGGIVLILSHLGIPLSSTHVTVSSIFGIGMIEHVPSLDVTARPEDRHMLSPNVEEPKREVKNHDQNKEDKKENKKHENELKEKSVSVQKEDSLDQTKDQEQEHVDKDKEKDQEKENEKTETTESMESKENTTPKSSLETQDNVEQSKEGDKDTTDMDKHENESLNKQQDLSANKENEEKDKDGGDKVDKEKDKEEKEKEKEKEQKEMNEFKKLLLSSDSDSDSYVSSKGQESDQQLQDVLGKGCDDKEKKNLQCPTFLSSRMTLKHVNVKLYRKIFFTWIITIFSSGVVTALLFLISKVIYKAAKSS